MARPSKYKPEFAAQAAKLCALGATDREVAEFFGVTERTLHNWQGEHEALFHALKVGKSPADDRVEKSLYRRATGYSFDAVKIVADSKTGTSLAVPYVEHVPPDTTACIFWLKNRRPDLWRDKHEIEHSGSLDWATEMQKARERATETERPKPN